MLEQGRQRVAMGRGRSCFVGKILLELDAQLR